MSKIEILNGGLLSTIQDLKRGGFKKFGMPPAGVMDKFSYKISQFLVQNDEFDGVIETTIMGVSIKFHTDMIVAVCGCENELFINEKRANLWQALNIKKGDILTLKNAKNGARNYIAFSKKMDLEKINGSLSTYLKSNIGGFNGRPLKKGDEITFIENSKEFKPLKIDSKFIPKFDKKIYEIRVILGPEDFMFEDSSINDFLNSDYEITNSSDRMGYRLKGKVLKHKKSSDILSNPTCFGVVQVPNDGLPIILMADAQTAGGYSKIATVLQSDLDILAQLKAGDKIFFKSVDYKEAVNIYKEYQKRISKIKNSLLKEPDIVYYNINVNGKDYKVSVERLENGL